MATFFGSDNADTITPEFVSGWISPSPAGSTPGNGTDYIFAADGHDSLDGGGGNDLITGGEGNDTIRGGAGADSLMGGDGNDIIYNDESVYLADRYHDEVYGGAGNDLIHAFGAGSYFGQENNDRFIVKPVTGAGQQLFHGGSGRDTLDFSTTHIFTDINLGTREVSTPNLNFSHIENVVGNYLANRITGDFNNNELSGDGGADTIDGGDGLDTISGGSGFDVIYGGNGSDEIRGGADNDVLYANRPGVMLGGFDDVRGGGGDDILISSGAGTYVGGSGNDNFICFAEDNSQHLFGGDGVDTLQMGDLTADTVINLTTGYTNVAWLWFNGIEDLVIGQHLDGGDNRLYGSSVDNRLVSGGGNDTIYGYGGDDELLGGRGDDTLVGGNGDDRLVGSHGNDWLRGGQGADVLEGGIGSDRFDFNMGTESQGWDHDRIVGFDGAGSAYGDTIDLFGIDANIGVSGNQAFEFLGAVSDSQGLSHGAGHLWTVNTGGNTYVRGNVDGDRFLELTILIEDGAGTSASDYERSDFIL
ncbi:calcium-binding protein [Amaricoccus tamworthensis]|uniref:calcium-binding protein n=1 Tax=Amaricoccus tamworthensis TaxID=57002 RepID=UPI003C7C33AF